MRGAARTSAGLSLHAPFQCFWERLALSHAEVCTPSHRPSMFNRDIRLGPNDGAPDPAARIGAVTSLGDLCPTAKAPISIRLRLETRRDRGPCDKRTACDKR